MESLLSHPFPAADKSGWLAQVQKELKSDLPGDALLESLRWPTNEGFVLDPYYTASDLSHLPLEAIQAVQKPAPGWLNAPVYQITDARKANSALRNTLINGADALLIALTTQPDLVYLLNGIKLSDTPVFFATNDSVQLVESLKPVAPYQLRGGLLVDPATQWIRSGQPLSTGCRAVVDVTKATADSPQFRTVCADGHSFHNAGATATQELAFLLASLADQYDCLTDAGLSIDQIAAKTIVTLAVGTSYFVEIAKLRALRVIYDRFLSHYAPGSIQYPIVHCQTSTFYDAAVTPYTNLLRATTEAMAAVIGGCDVLTVRPYDAIIQESGATDANTFSDRIARNVSTLLKEESYLAKTTDPSAGSYYIEQLTYQLAESAWALFLDVEKRGGFERAFLDGFIPDTIEEAYQAKVSAVKQGRVLVGVTKFRFDEKTDQPLSYANKVTGLLPDRRLAAEFE